MPAPRISSYFCNESFVEIEKVFGWMDGKCEYPSLEKEGNKAIPEIIDTLFYHYCYVPNLERVLFYYPTYLAKLEAERTLLFD